MRKENASEWIRAHIKKKELSLNIISEDLNIPVERLMVECEDSLWAEEFLALCAYLQVNVDQLINRENN